MNKFIPYEKLSKKEQRKINSARRSTWGALDPATRKPRNSKAYTRKKRTPDYDHWSTDVRFVFYRYFTISS